MIQDPRNHRHRLNRYPVISWDAAPSSSNDEANDNPSLFATEFTFSRSARRVVPGQRDPHNVTVDLWIYPRDFAEGDPSATDDNDTVEDELFDPVFPTIY